jgi:hypothetical protein
MRHFLFEEKEYKLRGTFKKRREIRDPAVELARLLRKRPRGGGKACGGTRKDFLQRCTAKMQYSNSIEAHKVQLEKYLVREGTALDGSQAELFGTDLKEYQANMAERNFRIFLSPESSSVNLNDLAERFVTRLEKQTGYHVYWQGACHYNTAHPHVHLLINGVDKQGREIKFPKDIVKTFMRETSRDICTAQVGLRTRQDLEREKEQALLSPRWTKLDNRIHDLCDRLSRIQPHTINYDKERILVRLETLRKLKLCVYENGGYTMKANWQEDLRANGRYNAFLKAREELRYTDSSLMKVYAGNLGLVSGKVTKVYRTDGDASDNHVVVLEGLDGKAYFIPLLKKPELYDSGKKSFLNEGEFITLKAYTTQRGRLTPVFYKRELKSVQNEVKKNNYTGLLADEVNRTNKGAWIGKQANRK